MCFRTAADGRQSTEIAVGANAASAIASVLADSVNTGGSSAGTVAIAVALGPAFRVRTSDVSSGALANCAMVPRHFTVGPLAALVARVYAFISGAVLLVSALRVVLALVTTSRQGISLRVDETRMKRKLNYAVPTMNRINCA